jgi:hypothetical protein
VSEPASDSAAGRTSAERIRALSDLHGFRLDAADVAGLVEGLPTLLDQLAAADPGDLGFGEPAALFDALPGQGRGAA